MSYICNIRVSADQQHAPQSSEPESRCDSLGSLGSPPSSQGCLKTGLLLLQLGRLCRHYACPAPPQPITGHKDLMIFWMRAGEVRVTEQLHKRHTRRLPESTWGWHAHFPPLVALQLWELTIQFAKILWNTLQTTGSHFKQHKLANCTCAHSIWQPNN